MHLRVKKMLICALGLALVVGTRGRAFSCDPPYGGWYEPCSMPCPCMAAPSSYGCQATCCSPCACVVAPPCGCSSPTTPAGGAGTTSAATTTPGGGDAGTTDAGTTGSTAGTTDSTSAADSWTDADEASVKTLLKGKGISDADADKLIANAKAVPYGPTDLTSFVNDVAGAGAKGNDLRDAVQHLLDNVKASVQNTQSAQLLSAPKADVIAAKLEAPAPASPQTQNLAPTSKTVTYYFTLMPVPMATTASVAQE